MYICVYIYIYAHETHTLLENMRSKALSPSCMEGETRQGVMNYTCTGEDRYGISRVGSRLV